MHMEVCWVQADSGSAKLCCHILLPYNNQFKFMKNLKYMLSMADLKFN